jgi:hypothetical protein
MSASAFVPINPTVVVFINRYGCVRAVANNIDANLKVVICNSNSEYEAEAANKAFDSQNPHPQIQVLAHGRHR